MNADNALIGKNYFEGDGQMPVPPEYFLQRIYDYDALLVLFASVVRPGAYVIARRREKSAGLTKGALMDISNPDTRLCVAMGWVPVCAMFQSGTSWNPDQIIARLMARDLRAQGGAERVADRLEAQEAEDVAKQKAVTREDIWNRSGDGWRTYQARTGASSIKFNDNLPVKGATDITAPTPRSTAGLGGDTPTTIGGEAQ